MRLAINFLVIESHGSSRVLIRGYSNGCTTCCGWKFSQWACRQLIPNCNLTSSQLMLVDATHARMSCSCVLSQCARLAKTLLLGSYCLPIFGCMTLGLPLRQVRSLLQGRAWRQGGTLATLWGWWDLLYLREHFAGGRLTVCEKEAVTWRILQQMTTRAGATRNTTSPKPPSLSGPMYRDAPGNGHIDLSVGKSLELK